MILELKMMHICIVGSGRLCILYVFFYFFLRFCRNSDGRAAKNRFTRRKRERLLKLKRERYFFGFTLNRMTTFYLRRLFPINPHRCCLTKIPKMPQTGIELGTCIAVAGRQLSYASPQTDGRGWREEE